MKEPLSSDDAKREIVRRLRNQNVRMPVHFMQAGRADNVAPSTVLGLLLAGFVEFSEFEGGEWRYRVKNGRNIIVAAFGPGDRLDLVTFIATRR